jgi:hypothetical protein
MCNLSLFNDRSSLKIETAGNHQFQVTSCRLQGAEKTGIPCNLKPETCNRKQVTGNQQPGTALSTNPYHSANTNISFTVPADYAATRQY